MSEFTIPRITTARLVLRAPVMADFEPYAALLASPRAMHMGGPYARKAAWGLFCSDIAQWALFGHGSLMVDLARGACVGQVGINHGPLFPEKELGWLLYDGCEGQGYATEAAAALREWARARGWRGLVSYVHPDNAASAAVARRLGATLDAAAVVQDPGDLVFRHP